MLGFKKTIIAGMMALALLFGVQTSSHALVLGFNDFDPSTTDPFVFDNGPGDINPALGAVTFNGPIGSWIVNVTTGLSKPLIGSAGAPQMDLNSINVTSATGGNLRIAVVDTGFTGGVGWQFAVGGTTEGLAQFLAFRDLTNSGQLIGTVFSNLGLFDPTAFSETDTGEFAPAPSGPFALGIVADINQFGAETTSFNASLRVPEPSVFNDSLQVVPEPSVLLLMGTGLVGLWGFRKRTKR